MKEKQEEREFVNQVRRQYEPPIVAEAKLTTLVKGVSGEYNDGNDRPHII